MLGFEHTDYSETRHSSHAPIVKGKAEAQNVGPPVRMGVERQSRLVVARRLDVIDLPLWVMGSRWLNRSANVNRAFVEVHVVRQSCFAGSQDKVIAEAFESENWGACPVLVGAKCPSWIHEVFWMELLGWFGIVGC
jgi:hypothetical protein